MPSRWPLVVLVLVAFGLRMYGLGNREFWFDEAASAYIAGLGPEGALTYLLHAVWEHPPFYYLSLYPWQLLAGTSDFALRFYSVFWGVLFVPLLFSLVKRLSDRHVALLAALLATFSPYLVAHSQEARMYSLLPCLAVLAVLSFWNAVQEARRPLWWLAYLVLMAMGVMTHYYFALIWVVTSSYLLLDLLRRKRIDRWAIAAQIVLVLPVVVWLITAPGLQQTLADVGTTVEDFSLAYKLDKVILSLLLAGTEDAQTSLLGYILAIGGWVLGIYGVVAARRTRLVSRGAWLFLTLFLGIPLLGSLLLVWPKSRHFGYLLIPGFTFMALGLVSLYRQGRAVLAAGALVFLLLPSYGLVAHYNSSSGSFGQAMAYINEHAQPGDMLIITHPYQWPLEEYYNDADWPVLYLPPDAAPPTPAQVEEALGNVAQEHDRLWLGPIGAWTADPEQLVARWLASHAFQTEQVWFPDSTSVALYLTDPQDLVPVETSSLVWGNRIRLQSLSADPLQIPEGNALRLRFSWRAGFDLNQRYTLNLLLVDEQGKVWAERRSEPCSGWCPTDTWRAGGTYIDQHALQIPAGTPPGDYRLLATWSPLAGGGDLSAEEDGQRVEEALVTTVTVLPAQGRAGTPEAVPNARRVRFGDEISLVGFELSSAELQPGGVVQLDTYWQAGSRPPGEYVLLIEAIDSQGKQILLWEGPPSASFYPTSLWRAGEFLRGQHDVPLPGILVPGLYRLRLSLATATGERLPVSGQLSRPLFGGLVSWPEHPSGDGLMLTSLRIVDRPRQFDLPPMQHHLDVTIGRRAHLVAYDLDPSPARAGGELHLTVYWQADGPMSIPYKVFVHLVDDSGRILAQHDAPPGDGCCPTNTWAAGEVIVDEHPLALGADLPSDTYQLVLGMYDEQAETRLPVFDAGGDRLPHDQVPIAEVTVEPALDIEQVNGAVLEPMFEIDYEYKVFLPLCRWGGK